MNRVDYIDKVFTRLENERIKRNMSQREMASLLDISLSTYKRMINCDIKKVDAFLIYKIEKIIGGKQ